MGHLDRDPTRPVYVISVAASIVSAHPRTLRIYEDEGLLCPARTATNIRLYSEEDVRRILWIRHLTQNRGVNLAGVRVLFELEERLGMRILETLFDEANAQDEADRAGAQANGPTERVTAQSGAEANGPTERVTAQSGAEANGPTERVTAQSGAEANGPTERGATQSATGLPGAAQQNGTQPGATQPGRARPVAPEPPAATGRPATGPAATVTNNNRRP